MLSDAELLRATDGDAEAFGVFYDRHVDAVLSYFYRRTACPHTAADLTAETFASALLGRKRFKSEKGNARQWLFGIAKHQLSRRLRSERVSDRALRKLGVRTPALDDQALERIEQLVDATKHFNALSEALQKLPSGLADAVILRVGKDMSFAEVAKELGCSQGAARVRVSRGLGRLASVVRADG